jgi:prepilin-type N-terminal cleavage/methylation domain-containing protein
MMFRRTKGLAGKRRRTVPGHRQKGFVLIELLISIAIFGVISVSFLSALIAGYHGVIVAHDQTMAESLTRTTFEDVSDADFPVASYQKTVLKYDVIVQAENITDLDTYQVVEGPSNFQMITVTIRRHVDNATILNSWMTKVRL